MFAIIFGQFTDVFGQGASSPNFEDKVSEIALYFLYLGIGSAAGAFLQSCLWIYSGNRQANRLRMRYLHAVLHQDIAYFDTSASTGALLAGLNDDTQQVQAAVSEKVAHFIQHTVTFLAGWIVAFVRGWDMALVMVGCLPFLATVGGVLSKVGTLRPCLHGALPPRTVTSSRGMRALAMRMLARLRVWPGS